MEYSFFCQNAFHPGSLKSCTVDAETLDLAKQAGSLQNISSVQEICLGSPIVEPCSYQRATNILASAKRREGKGSLKPVISTRMKLVPRNFQKELDRSAVRNDKESVGPGAVQIKKEKVEGSKERLETNSKIFLKLCPKTEKTDNQTVKVKTEVPSAEEPCKGSGNDNKSSDGSDGAQTKTKEIQRNKRLSKTEEEKFQFSGPSQGEKRPEDLQGATSSKRPRVSTNTDGEEATVVPEWEGKKEKTVEGHLKVSCKLIECRCGTHKPIYFCGRCQLRISEQDILNHMNGFAHQKMFQEVFYTDEKMFVHISKQSFHSALETLLGLGFDLPGCSKPPITSDPVCIEDSHSSQTSTQNDVFMDIDSAEDCDEVTDSFMGTETTSRTNEAQIECGEDASDVKTHPRDASTVSLFTGSDYPTDFSQTTTTKLDRTSSKQKMTPSKLSAGSSAAAISKTTSKFATCTSLLERTESASKDGAFPSKAAHSPHADSSRREVACKKTSSSKRAKTAVKPSVTIKKKVSFKIQTESEKHGNTEPCSRTAHGKKSVEANANTVPDADERSQLGFLDIQEPLDVSASKTSSSGNQVKVGTSHLIVVSWEAKQQVYCMLCLVKLHMSSSHHLVSINHQHNYVKRKYPEWTAKPSEFESKLNHTVALLAKIEKNLPHSRHVQKLKVTKEVYQDLGCLPDGKAVEKVKAMVENFVSSSVHHADEVPDPCEISRSGDEAQQTGTTVSDHDPPDLNSESLHRSEDDQIAETSQQEELEQDEDILPQIAPTPAVNFGLSVEPPEVNLQETQELLRDEAFTPKLQPVTKTGKQEQVPIPLAASTVQKPLPTRVLFGGNSHTSSNLPFYLDVGLCDSAAIIGKSCIWECQGISLRTLFLCDCCEEKVPLRNICHHMTSTDHQLKYLERYYPEYLQRFWYDEQLLPEMKLDILKAVVQELSKQEFEKTAAPQCVCVVPELHEFLSNASFSEALKIVQNLMDGENQGFIQLPVAVAEPEKASTTIARMEVDCSPNVDPIVSNDGSPHTPQKLSGGAHPEPTSAESRLKMFDSFYVKEEEESLMSASSPVAPTVGQSLNVSVRDENSSSRNRPAAPDLTSDSPKDDNLSVAPKPPKRNLKVLEKLISVLKKSLSKTVTDRQSANANCQEPKDETVPESKLEQIQADLLDRSQKDPSGDLKRKNQPSASYENSSSVGDTPVQDECGVSRPPSDSTTNPKPGQTPESSGNPEIKSPAVCQSAIKTIITVRQKPANPLYQKRRCGEASRDHRSDVHADVHGNAVAAAQSQMTVTGESSGTFQPAASRVAANNLQSINESQSQTRSSTNPLMPAALVNHPLHRPVGQSFSPPAFSIGDVPEQLQQQNHQVLQQQQVHLQQHPLQQSLQQYQPLSQHQIMQQHQRQVLQQVEQYWWQQQVQQQMQQLLQRQQERLQQHLFQQQHYHAPGQ